MDAFAGDFVELGLLEGLFRQFPLQGHQFLLALAQVVQRGFLGLPEGVLLVFEFNELLDEISEFGFGVVVGVAVFWEWGGWYWWR